jgi:hypothetical protein
LPASFWRLSNDDPIAFNGEAGYQADRLMPDLRWISILFYRVEKFPSVQVPAGEIGVVIAQAGRPMPIGAKSAVYFETFEDFSDVRAFVERGGQKGRGVPVRPPGGPRRRACCEWIDNDPDFDTIRDEPRYKAVIDRVQRFDPASQDTTRFEAPS